MRKFLWLILVNSFLLTACVQRSTNVDLTQQLIGQERRSPDALENDKAIEQTAIEEFKDDAEIFSQSQVNINVYNGLALLTGDVSTEAVKNKILDIVRVIPHVKIVRDSMTLGVTSDPDSRANDLLITEQVKAALTQIYTLPNFNSSMIKVVTENGVVYLMGLVTKEEGSVVVNVTRLQSGVKQIVTVFEYTN
jgi:osmotically-inducible protein OsmY